MNSLIRISCSGRNRRIEDKSFFWSLWGKIFAYSFFIGLPTIVAFWLSLVVLAASPVAQKHDLFILVSVRALHGVLLVILMGVVIYVLSRLFRAWKLKERRSARETIFASVISLLFVVAFVVFYWKTSTLLFFEAVDTKITISIMVRLSVSGVLFLVGVFFSSRQFTLWTEEVDAV